MGTEIRMRSFTRDDRRQFRRKVQACVSVLDRMLREHILYFHEHRVEQAVALRELPTLKVIDPRGYHGVQSDRRRYHRTIEERIAFAVRGRQIEPIEPRLAAYAILGMVNGIQDWFRDSGPLSIDEVADGYCDFVTNRLLRPV